MGLDCEWLLIPIQLPLSPLSDLKHTKPRHLLHLLESITVQQNPYDIFNSGFLRDEDGFVVELFNKYTVIDTHQSSLAHLKAELGLPPRIAGAQFCWSCVVLKHHGSLDGDSSFSDSHVHRQVKQLGIPVAHPILGEKKPNQLATAHVLPHHHRLILYVWTEALGVDLQRDA